MIRLLFFALCLVAIAIPAAAQDWVDTDDGGAAYNCALIRAVLADFGAYDLARLEDDRYTVSHFFELVIANCKAEETPADASSDHEPNWIDSPFNESQYDCAVLEPVLAEYGDETLVRGASNVTYSLREFFASLVPDCVTEVDVAELMSRIGSTEGWVTGTNDSYEFNCDVVSAAIKEYGHLGLYRDEEQELSVSEYFEIAVPLCEARADLSVKTEIASSESGWQTVSGSQTNCETVKILLNQYGAPDFLRSGGESWTLFSYYQEVSGCLPYAILARESTALRECPDDECSVILRLTRDTALTITGMSESWYQVGYRASDVYIAVSPELALVTEKVEPNDGLNIDEIDCFLSPVTPVNSAMQVKLIDLSASARDIEITLYPPLTTEDIHIVKFEEEDAVHYVAVPVRYRATYEVLVQCE